VGVGPLPGYPHLYACHDDQGNLPLLCTGVCNGGGAAWLGTTEGRKEEPKKTWVFWSIQTEKRFIVGPRRIAWHDSNFWRICSGRC